MLLSEIPSEAREPYGLARSLGYNFCFYRKGREDRKEMSVLRYKQFFIVLTKFLLGDRAPSLRSG
jgi:hypothetical protein